MIEFEAATDHVLSFRAEGKLTKIDIQAVVRKIDEKLARHDRIGLVSDVTKLDGMTLDGMAEDLRAELKYLGKWHRFPRLSLIATEGFIKSAAQIFDKVLPQVEIRVFEPAQREQAIAFAAEAGEAA
ncbi:SpoIIAA-like protein [Mesorhizobium sp. J18]|uniref:STAS/SEC14 domain-containing protein n=1 Tax=Mesorhizobium sp. J18 TaxID=935263 RepID=UPI00119998E9|nr:STAS/SEC14 domain-containing protein [Mesorhizobium sp. J18]TWG97998.1 SpoIIAA-like protein [Mesorhizobium sp. J18]